MTFKNFIVTIESFDGQQEQSVSANPMTIGRSYSVDLPLILTEVSRCHIKVYWQNSQIFIEDLGSKNGTFLNGNRIPSETLVPYQPGDEVSLGQTEEKIKFEAICLAQDAEDHSVKEEAKEVRHEPVSELAGAPPPLSLATSSIKDDFTKQVEGLQKDVRELQGEKEKLISETHMRSEKLAQINLDIQNLENTWKVKTQELLRQQEDIKIELQKELVEMKKLFDGRQAELSNIQEKVQALRLEDEELSQKIEKKDQLLKEAELEADRFFIESQNELLQEKERLEKLKEIRTLEVEMEMANLKSQKMEEFQNLEIVRFEDRPKKFFDLNERQRRLAGFAVMAILIMMVSLIFRPTVQTAEMASQAGCSAESP